MRNPLSFLWMLFLVHSTTAQQYLFARYTPKDGLVNSRTRFLYQDRRGRLYISTFGGLSVYDGNRFLNYTTDNGLVASLVNDVMEMGDDSVWVIPNGPAIHCLVHGRLKDIHTADNFYPVINQLIRVSDGFLYAISDDGLFRYEGNRFVPIRLCDDKGQNIEGSLAQAFESNGRLIILKDPFLGGYPGPGSLIAYNLRTHHSTVLPKSQENYFLAKAPDGRVLVATAAGVRCLDPLGEDSVRFCSMPAPYQLANTIVSRFLYFDNHHNCWITTERGITRLDAATGMSQEFTTANGLPPGLIAGFLQDKEDNCWFANDRNGIVKLPSREVAYYPQPLPDFKVGDLGVVPGTDSVWFYNVNKRSLLFLHDSVTQLFLADGPIPDKGRMYIGQKASWMTANCDLYSIRFLPGHRFRAVPAWHDSAFRFGGGCLDRKGNLILVSDKITLVAAGQNLPIHQPFQYPLPYLCDEAAIDRQGHVWTVTRSDAIRVFGFTDTSGRNPGLQLLASYTKGIPGSSARSITVDNSGRVFIGTRDHGLYCLYFDGFRFMSWKHFTTSNGLSENFINYLQCDADNTVWACTPAGLDRIQLDSTHITIDNLSYGHDNYQGAYRVFSTRNGIHWALVNEGYMKIGPLPVKTGGYRPQILFSEVLIGNTPNPDTAQTMLTLAHDRNTITFHIGVTSFIDETQTRYSYLLEGSGNRNWSPYTGESAIYLVSLSPGRYTLRVRAHFLAGDYPDLLSAYSFHILPPWWQTWLFRGAMALALAVLLVLGFRVYIRRRLLQQRLELENQQAIERERTRIATDMHDELGAGLSRIKFLSETIGIKKQQQLPIEEEITGIRRYSHEMIDKMGEIVWALNERNDSLSDLLSYARSYAAEYLLQAGIRCHVEAPAELPSFFVSGEFRRNVYLTIKEALHNIVKHAQAEQVEIRMTVQTGEQLIISIKDDGVGFDRESIRPFANGLNNMQRRIAGLGGSLYIYNARGTTIRLSVPL